MNQSTSNVAPLYIVLYGDVILPNEYRLRAKADFPFSVVSLADDASTAQKEAALVGADAVVCVRFDHPSRHATKLRWIGAGT